MIYDEIGYYGVTAADFARDLNAITAPTIDLRINSPGGEVFDGLAIYEAVRRHPATVTTHIDSLAASIASVIAMAGDRRVIARTGTMMIHDAAGICIGNAQDMAEMRDLLDRCSNTIAQVYADRAGGTVATWRDAMRAETWYSAGEAVAAQLATEEAAPADAADSADAAFQEFANRLQTGQPNEWARLTAGLRNLPPLRTSTGA